MLNLFQHQYFLVGFIYIVTNLSRTVLYIGVTSNIRERTMAHKVGKGSGFSSKYGCCDLIHFEKFPDMNQAIQREKQLKRWKRDWKLNLIRRKNENLIDLAKDWYTEEELENARKYL